MQQAYAAKMSSLAPRDARMSNAAKVEKPHGTLKSTSESNVSFGAPFSRSRTMASVQHEARERIYVE
jgi:hypothetical protein